MYIFLTILIILVCIFIMLIVLVQNPKGSGLGAGFGGGGGAANIMGVQRTGDILEKLTWGSAIALLVLSLATTFFIDRGSSSSEKTKAEQVINETFVPTAPTGNTVPLLPE